MEAMSPSITHYLILWDKLFLLNGVLYKSYSKKNGTEELVQLITTREMQKDI
jgi:hypothetical protein